MLMSTSKAWLVEFTPSHCRERQGVGVTATGGQIVVGLAPQTLPHNVWGIKYNVKDN